MTANVLIIAEHDGAKLNVSTAKCVTCAQRPRRAPRSRSSCAPWTLARSPPRPPRSPASAAWCTIENPANAHALAAVLAPQIAALAGPYTHLLGPSTTFGKDLMPRIAALLGRRAGQRHHGDRERRRASAARSIAGNAILTVEAAARRKLVGTVRMASFEAAGNGGQRRHREGERSRVTLPTHTRFVSVSAAKSDRPDLQTAARVDLRRPRARQRRGLQDPLQPRGQARRRGRRLARRGGCGLRAERDAGRPDRQDHRAGAVHRGRDLRAPSST